jgi:aspartyl-tRNA(Asn)/glutamyl-tRNA(Gln) amidotransferase subunit A
MNKPIWQCSATELAPLLARGELTPQELLTTALQRIELLNPTLNAVITLNEQAQADAEDSARRLHQGKPRSPLEGIPITVKDNIPVKNLRLTWGSRAFADNIAEHDELPVERLRNAGAVIIGKTNVPEFTVEGYTHNLLFGTTRNPWNTELTPGGSSGGAVASVAAGITAVAIGTDGTKYHVDTIGQ